MGQPHKHAELIKAWADGAVIQKNLGYGFWGDINSPEWDRYGEGMFRIKPKTIKYRNFLWRCESSHEMYVSAAYADSAANNSQFIKWLDDWQEVEI